MSLLLWSKSKPAKCFPLIDIYERKNYPAISGRQTCCKGWKALSPDNLAQVPRVRLLQDIVRKLQAAKFLQFPNEGWNWSRSSLISHLLYILQCINHQRSALTKKRDTTTTILISRSCHFRTKFSLFVELLRLHYCGGDDYCEPDRDYGECETHNVSGIF